MFTKTGVAKALLKMHFKGTSGLRKYIQNARTRNELISLVEDYMHKNPSFDRLVYNAGMNAKSVANLLHVRK